MFTRILNPSKSNSFFIFGARGAGKTTFVQEEILAPKHVINLLEESLYLRYANNVDLLVEDLKRVDPKEKWIFIDEVQRVPNILNVVHNLIEKKKYKFILTGSSARKLKRQSANLLAGRAFSYQMFPLTYREIGEHFDLDFVLKWGSLPKVFSLELEDREEFLKSYAQTYLREEILQEQIVRNEISFRNFLEITAQHNGKLINFSSIGKDVGVDPKTVQNYYQILEDTLVGFFLPAFHRSIRKSVGMQPKFYIFDLGVKRALERSFQQELNPKTASFGQAFEHYLICEIFRLNSYARSDYQLSQYHTTAGGEIDLVLHRGREVIAIEIKSTSVVDESEVKKLSKIAEGLQPTKIYYLSQDVNPRKIGNVRCLHWRDFFEELF